MTICNSDPTVLNDPLVCVVFLQGNDYENAVGEINDAGGSTQAAAEHLAQWDYGRENDDAACINGHTERAEVERFCHHRETTGGQTYWLIADHHACYYALYRRRLPGSESLPRK